MKYNFQIRDDFGFSMYSDHLRNQFYDTILKDNVQDKNCIDVGFGTGILSLLAIKHGARHITAYEVHPEVYKLGCYMIKQLGLDNRITLHNKYFDPNDIDPGISVLFHEILGANLWEEWVYQCFTNRVKILPSQYFCEYYFVELDDVQLEHYKNFSAPRTKDMVWVNRYNQVRGDSWPDCASPREFVNLPAAVKDEIKNKFSDLCYSLNPGVAVDPGYILEM